jgi:membrane protein DedA with SNARE-associated domain
MSTKALEKISPRLLDSLKEQLKQNKIKAIIVMGLLPKLRFLSPIICGSGGIQFRLFLLLNMAVTAFYTAFYIMLGIVFHNQLKRIMHKLELWQTVIFIVLMITITVFVFVRVRKSVMKAKEKSATN